METVVFVLSQCARTAGAAASSTETGRHRQTTSAMDTSTSLRSKSSASCQLSLFYRRSCTTEISLVYLNQSLISYLIGSN